jgi:hypothetical protein
MVLVLSATANTSTQIKREVERAVNKGIPVIPLRIEDVAPSKKAAPIYLKPSGAIGFYYPDWVAVQKIRTPRLTG